jgi:hypothetical protein
LGIEVERWVLRRNPRVADQHHHALKRNGKHACNRGRERGANALAHFVTADAQQHAAVIRNL